MCGRGLNPLARNLNCHNFTAKKWSRLSSVQHKSIEIVCCGLSYCLDYRSSSPHEQPELHSKCGQATQQETCGQPRAMPVPATQHSTRQRQHLGRAWSCDPQNSDPHKLGRRENSREGRLKRRMDAFFPPTTAPALKTTR